MTIVDVLQLVLSTVIIVAGVALMVMAALFIGREQREEARRKAEFERYLENEARRPR